MLAAPLEIETARLMLLRPKLSDAPEIFERYASDPEVTRYLGWPRHRSLEDTRAFLAFSDSEWKRWPAGPYLIRARSDRQLLGSTGFTFESPDRASTGYVLARDRWGLGYATEALVAVIAIGRAIDIARLFALCHPEHRASRRVLEKCGFALDVQFAEKTEFPNLAPGMLQDVVRYELGLHPPEG